MTAYQDELKRSLPKLGCEGVFDFEYDTLSIQYVIVESKEKIKLVFIGGTEIIQELI